MPLKQGSSQKIINENIREMIHSGIDPNRAVAAAYRNAETSKPSVEEIINKILEIIKQQPLPKSNVIEKLEKIYKQNFYNIEEFCKDKIKIVDGYLHIKQ